MQTPDNPLLDFSGLPRYGSIKPENVAPAVDRLLAENRAEILRLTKGDTAATWGEFAEPLENANERLWRAWSAVAHLHAVDDNPAIRDAYNTNLLRSPGTALSSSRTWAYTRNSRPARRERIRGLPRARRKIVENALRDFRLGGAELETEKKRRFAQIQEELAALEAKFSENVLDATNAFSVIVTDRAGVTGIPQDVLRAAAEAARKQGRDGWKFTLHAPSYGPLMQYADNHTLRESSTASTLRARANSGKPNSTTLRSSSACSS
jgi:oligopeptidase A